MIRSAEANGVASVDLGYTYGGTVYNIVVDGDIVDSNHAIEAMEDAMFLDGFTSGVSSVNGDDIMVTTPTGIRYTGSSSAKTGAVSVDSGYGIVSTTAVTGVSIDRLVDVEGTITAADGTLTWTANNGTETWVITGSDGDYTLTGNGAVQATGDAATLYNFYVNTAGNPATDIAYTATTYVNGNYTVGLADGYGDVATASTNLAAVTGVSSATINADGTVAISFTNGYIVKGGVLVDLTHDTLSDAKLNDTNYTTKSADGYAALMQMWTSKLPTMVISMGYIALR